MDPLQNNIEWLTPQDEEQFAREPATAGDSPSASLFGHQLSGRNIRRTVGVLPWGLSLILLLVILSKFGIHQGSAARETPPRWLPTPPLTAPLSPFMVADCWYQRCQSIKVSSPDVQRIAPPRTFRFSATAVRVLDQTGAVRAIELDIADAQGDRLTSDAVRVVRAPNEWDGDSADLLTDTPTTRWLVNAKSGLWMIESRAARASCHDNLSEYLALYEKALTRVRADQLGL